MGVFEERLSSFIIGYHGDMTDYDCSSENDQLSLDGAVNKLVVHRYLWVKQITRLQLLSVSIICCVLTISWKLQ